MSAVILPPEQYNLVEMAGTSYLNGNLDWTFQYIADQPHPGLFAVLVFSWLLEVTPVHKDQAAAWFIRRYQRWCSEHPSTD